MSNTELEEILKTDFEKLASGYDRDSFTRQVLHKLHRRQRARMGVIAFASGIGAAFAASQVPAIISSLSPVISNTSPESSTLLDPQLLATMMLAALLCATAIIVKQED